MIRKVIDLTYDIHEGMTTFGAHWHPSVLIKQMGKITVEGRETRKVSFGTHTGTHIDSPLHFVKGGISIDKIPIDRLIGLVTILDFTKLNENGKVTKEMIENLPLEKNVLFRFGWGKNWGTENFYKGYPFITAEAAQFLIDKKVNLIAMDTPSPDDSRIKLEVGQLGTEEDSPIHKMFLRNNVLLVEYVANLDMIDELDGWTISVMPLRLKDADGSPARVYIFK
jgi:arylformamidase